MADANKPVNWEDLGADASVTDAIAAVAPSSSSSSTSSNSATSAAGEAAAAAAETTVVVPPKKEAPKEDAIEESTAMLYQGEVKVVDDSAGAATPATAASTSSSSSSSSSSAAEAPKTSMYAAAAKFEDLNIRPEFLKGIYAKKFERPSKVQASTLPYILQGRNVIAQSHAGTGKTAAFALGMLSAVDQRVRKVQALCLCPTHELADQVAEVISELGLPAGISVARVRSVPAHPIELPIVVGTPGSVLGSISRHTMDLSAIKVFVLDEADHMLDEKANAPRPGAGGFRGGRGGARGGMPPRPGGSGAQGLAQQSAEIRRSCVKANPNLQVLLFSATFSDDMRDFAKEVAPNPVQISIKKEKLIVPGITQLAIHCQDVADKYQHLKALFESDAISVSKSFVFCNSVAHAKDVTNRLRTDKMKVSVIYGALTPEERGLAMRDFKEGRSTILVATDVLARGIDIPDVQLVVNWDVPMTFRNEPNAETYLHRIGRTGRFGKLGCAVTLTEPSTKSSLDVIDTQYGKRLTVVSGADPDELDTAIKNALNK